MVLLVQRLKQKPCSWQSSNIRQVFNHEIQLVMFEKVVIEEAVCDAMSIPCALVQVRSVLFVF